MRNSLTYIAIPIICICLSCSCASWKRTLASSGGADQAIENAITDFMHTSKKLLKDDEVFIVNVDTLKNDIINVRISGMNYFPYSIPTNTVLLGKHYKMFPTKYVIKNGKLFYWYDPNIVITQEVIDVMLAYGQIYYMRWEMDIPSVFVNDAQKSAQYFFDKYNLTCYKKIECSWIADIPELKCKQKPKEKRQKSNFPKLLPY